MTPSILSVVNGWLSTLLSAIAFFSNHKPYSLVRVARSNIAYSYFENEYKNQFEKVYDGSCIVVANDNTYIVDSNNVYVKKKTK